MSEEHPYQKEWDEYRRLRNLQWIIFALPFFISILLALLYFLTGFQLGSTNFGIEFLFFALWAIFYLMARARFHRWKCPRCHHRFFTPSFWVTEPILLSNCRHCKLPKYFGSKYYS